MISIDCPECGESLKDSADTCPRCQSALSDSVKKSLLERSQGSTDQANDTPGRSNYFLRHWAWRIVFGEIILDQSLPS